MSFLPPVPSDPKDRQIFTEIWQRELRVFRRRPSFIVGMTMAGLSGFGLLLLSDGILPGLAILFGTFGVAAVYDTVTRHFCNVLFLRESHPESESRPEASDGND